MQGTSPSWPKAITFFFFSGEKEVVEEKVDNAGGFQQRNRKSQAFLFLCCEKVKLQFCRKGYH